MASIVELYVHCMIEAGNKWPGTGGGTRVFSSIIIIAATVCSYMHLSMATDCTLHITC